MDMTIKDQVTYFANLHNYPTTKVTQELPGWLRRLNVSGGHFLLSAVLMYLFAQRTYVNNIFTYRSETPLKYLTNKLLRRN